MSKKQKRQHVVFKPLVEAIYLARPPNHSSSVVLQAQRLDPYGPAPVDPIYDVKQNTRPIARLLNKVKTLNQAVGSIIPDPTYNSSAAAAPLSPTRTPLASPTDLMFPKPQRAHSISSVHSLPYNNSFNPANPLHNSNGPCISSLCNTCATPKEPSFSVYDRDAPARDPPLALFNRFEVAFSPKTVPLLSRSTRLDRSSGRMTDNYTAFQQQQLWSTSDALSWYIVPEEPKATNNTPHRIHAYRVYDKSTNMLVGKWKRRSTLTCSAVSPNGSLVASPRLGSISSSSSTSDYTLVPDEDHCGAYSPRSTLGMHTAAARYFLNQKAGGAAAASKTPFFSGEAYSLVAAANRAENGLGGSAAGCTQARRELQEEEWCFVVNRGKTQGGWTVLASLKGYELHLVDAHDSPLRHFYLDEYVRHLRLKYVARAQRQQQQQRRRSHDNDDDDFYSSGEEAADYPRQQQQPLSTSPPLCANTLQSGRLASGTPHAYRLRVNDALSLMAIALMLNLDQAMHCRLYQQQHALLESAEEDATIVAPPRKVHSLSSDEGVPSGPAPHQVSSSSTTKRRLSLLHRGYSAKRAPPASAPASAMSAQSTSPSGPHDQFHQTSSKWYTRVIPHLFG